MDVSLTIKTFEYLVMLKAVREPVVIGILRKVENPKRNMIGQKALKKQRHVLTARPPNLHTFV